MKYLQMDINNDESKKNTKKLSMDKKYKYLGIKNWDRRKQAWIHEIKKTRHQCNLFKETKQRLSWNEIVLL